jgi:hypothetical protein
LFFFHFRRERERPEARKRKRKLKTKKDRIQRSDDSWNLKPNQEREEETRPKQGTTIVGGEEKTENNIFL